MNFKNKICALALVLSVVVFSPDAKAISIGGKTYTKFLTATSSLTFGYWAGMQKYSTTAYAPIKVTETYVDPDFAAYDVDKIGAVGFTTYAFGTDVSSGVFDVVDAQGRNLLHGTVADADFSTNFYNNLSVVGLYNAVSGLWLTDGLIGSQFYAEVAFHTITGWNGRDIHAANGTFNIYRSRTGNTNVPEPATMTLLATSLVGLLGRRSRKARC